MFRTTPLAQLRFNATADRLLEREYGTSITALCAERFAEAAHRAGYSPEAFVRWLAEIDGLERSP